MLAGLLAPSAAGSVTPLWVPNPDQFAIEAWINLLPPVFNEVPKFATEDNWREWADALCLSAVGRAYGIPTHYGFNTWRDWAIRVYQVLQ